MVLRWYAPLAVLASGAGIVLAQTPTNLPAIPTTPPTVAGVATIHDAAGPNVGSNLAPRSLLSQDKPGVASIDDTSLPGTATIGPDDAAPPEAAPSTVGKSAKETDASANSTDTPCQSFWECCLQPKPARFFFQTENLVAWMKSAPSNFPLVTGGDALNRGRLGLPGTAVLAGGSDLEIGTLYGVRASVGTWLGQKELFGIEVGGFILHQVESSFSANSAANGSPLLARPFLNADTGTSGSVAVSLPGVASGSVVLDSWGQLWGIETNVLIRGLSTDRPHKLNLLVGYRHLDLQESLGIQHVSTLLPGQANPFVGGIVTAPASLGASDRFETRNQFYGGQIGAQGEFRRGRWEVGGFGKLGIGAMQQTVIVSGLSAAVNPNGLIGIASGGVLAQNSNIGRVEMSEFALVPEFGVRVGYHVTQRLSLTVGYNFLYLSNVIRPGDLIDPLVTPGQLALSSAYTGSGTRPLLVGNTSDVWVQALTLGLQFNY